PEVLSPIQPSERKDEARLEAITREDCAHRGLWQRAKALTHAIPGHADPIRSDTIADLESPPRELGGGDDTRRPTHAPRDERAQCEAQSGRRRRHVEKREVMHHDHDRAGVRQRRKVLNVERVHPLARRGPRERPQNAAESSVLSDRTDADAPSAERTVERMT